MAIRKYDILFKGVDFKHTQLLIKVQDIAEVFEVRRNGKLIGSSKKEKKNV